MTRNFTLPRFDAALLAVNLLAFGVCLTLMILKGDNVPLVLIAIGSGLASMAKLVRGYLRPSAPAGDAAALKREANS